MRVSLEWLRRNLLLEPEEELEVVSAERVEDVSLFVRGTPTIAVVDPERRELRILVREIPDLPREGRHGGTLGEWHYEASAKQTPSGRAIKELAAGYEAGVYGTSEGQSPIPLPLAVFHAGLAPGTAVVLYDMYDVPRGKPPGWERIDRNYRVFEVTDELLALGREMKR